MSKKKTNKRLDNLFENVEKEETKPVKRPRKNGTAATPPSPLPSRLRPGSTAKAAPPRLEEPTALATAVSNNSGAMSLAFRTDEKSWATLRVVDESSPRTWAMEEQMLVKQVADQLSLALENARLFNEARRRAREMASLAEVGQHVSSSLDLRVVLERIAEHAKELLDSSTSAVYIPEPNGQAFRAITAIGDDAEEIKNDPIHLGEGILGGIAAKKVGEIINNAGNDDRALEIAGTPKLDHEHLMAVPLMSGERINGIMAVWRKGKGAEYQPADMDLLLGLSRQAAIAVENARLFDETRLRNEELAALNDIIAAANQTLELRSMLNVVLEKVLASLNFDAGIITMFNKEKGILEGLARIGLPENPSADPSVGLKGTLCEHTFNKKDMVVLDDLRRNAPVNVNDLIKANYLSYLGVPLEAKGETLGTLCVFRHNAGEIEKSKTDLARSISNQISLAVQNASLYERTEKSESELRALFSAMNDVIIVFNKEGRYMSIAPTNPSRLFRAPEEMLGKKIADVLPPEVAQPIMDAIQQALAFGETVKIEYPLTINQKEYWFDGSVSKLAENEVFFVARDITDRKLNELIQAAITQISEAALTTPDMKSLLKTIHESVNTLMPARNFYVALYDEYTDTLSFPYYADEHDSAWPPQKPGQSLTGYVLRTGKPLLVTPEIYSELEDTGEIQGIGTRGTDWLGVPLRSGSKRLGVLAVQTYDPDSHLTEKDRDTLSLVAGQASVAIERKFAQEELNKFKLGIERSDAAIFMTDVNGTIVYTNPGFEKVYGYKPEEAIGKTPRIIKSGVMPDEVYKNFWGTLLSKGTVSGELTNRAKDGRLVQIAGTNSPILDENNNIVGFLAVHHDMTATKRAEDALKRQNQYLAAAAEIGRLITSTLDLNNIFSRTVRLVSERFGYYHSAIFIVEETGFNAVLREAVGPSAEQMKQQAHHLPVNEKSIVGKVTYNGEPIVVNNTAIDPTHKLNPWLPDTRAEAAIPLRVGGRIIGALDIQSTNVDAFTQDDIAVLQILTDQVAIAIDNARSYELSQQAVMEMREVDRLKSQFLANMSHELRTPLNSIIGFSRVILKGIDGPVTDLQQQDLTAIYNSGQHLLGLINDVLDLAKIEAGKMELAFEEVNIGDLINSVASTTSGLIKDKPIKFVKNVQIDLPTVRADAIRVRQIMINLISNAAKFTEEGDIVLDAHVQSGPAGQPEIIISVTDTGPGISPQDQLKLFQAFSQVDDSPTRKTGGTGLGLSICQQLVQMHGGQIGVHSTLGKGSTFYFTLPVFRLKDETPASGGTKVILAVDDDPQVISLYERYLQPQGYQVISVTDPAKAKERAKQLMPYAITLDIMMPGRDGWSVLTDLKSDSVTSQIPVIICSIIEDQERGFSLGAADYLLKPILEDDLLGALDRLNSDGSIREVLIVDDDPTSLRLLEKWFKDQNRYKIVLAEGGKQGWDAITSQVPQAVILDLFMPDMDGFTILEKMRDNPRLRDIPVIVVSGGDLTREQQQQLSEFGQRLVNKSSLNEKDFINNLERSLKRAQRKT